MSQKEENQTLEKLGLTPSQAKIYLAMFNLGNPPAKALYEKVKIARQNIYRILSELEEIGLVERIVAKPMRFRPTPIKNALSILLDQKYNEASQLRKQATEVFASSEKWTKASTETLYENSFELRKVYPNDPRPKAAFASAKTVIKLVDEKISWPVFSSFVGDMVNALNKGVKIRVITENAAKQKKMPKCMKSLEKHPSFEMRFMRTLFPTRIFLIDFREVAIWYVPTLNFHQPSKPQVLWSTHRGLIELASNYFESLWNQATN